MANGESYKAPSFLAVHHTQTNYSTDRSPVVSVLGTTTDWMLWEHGEFSATWALPFATCRKSDVAKEREETRPIV